MRNRFSGSRRALGALAVYTAGLFGGCAISNQIQHDSGPIRVENGGVFGKNFPRYKVGSFEEAEKLMGSLVREGAPNEDQWIAYTQGDGVVVQDIGENPKNVDDPNAPLMQRSYLSITSNTEIEEKTLEVLPEGTVVKYYHIHPLSEEDMLDSCDDPALNSSKPSDSDFISRAWRQKKFKEKYPHLVLEPATVIGFGYAVDYWVADDKADNVEDDWKGLCPIRPNYMSTVSEWLISNFGTENKLSVEDLLQKLDKKGLHTRRRKI